MLLGDAVGRQCLADLPLPDDQGLRLTALLVVLHQAAQLVVDRLDHLEATLLLQGLLQHGVKGRLLLVCGHGGLGAEHRFHHSALDVLCMLGVVEGVVQVGGAVIEGREQKAQLRRGHHPVRCPVVELILLDIITQGRLGQLHRTHTAQNVREHLRGCVVLLVTVL